MEGGGAGVCLGAKSWVATCNTRMSMYCNLVCATQQEGANASHACLLQHDGDSRGLVFSMLAVHGTCFTRGPNGVRGNSEDA